MREPTGKLGKIEVMFLSYPPGSGADISLVCTHLNVIFMLNPKKDNGN